MSVMSASSGGMSRIWGGVSKTEGDRTEVCGGLTAGSTQACQMVRDGPGRISFPGGSLVMLISRGGAQHSTSNWGIGLGKGWITEVSGAGWRRGGGAEWGRGGEGRQTFTQVGRECETRGGLWDCELRAGMCVVMCAVSDTGC